MSLTVAGIDPSLTAAGIAVVELGAVPAWSVTTVGWPEKKNATLTQRKERLRKLADAIIQLTLHADLAVIEGPAYNSRTGSQHDRSGLWWKVVEELLDLGIPVLSPIPQHGKIYATGKGNAGKVDVMAAAIKRYPDVDITDDNTADATVFAAMGARHLGHPVEATLPLTHLRAMEMVGWPAFPNLTGLAVSA